MIQQVVIQKILGSVFTKKRLVSWGASIAILVGAAAVGMSQPEFKEAICGAPALEAEK